MLSHRQLNRALLARQGLLDRWDVPVAEALHRLIGLQSQAPQAAYTALWARLNTFDPDELSTLLERRSAVRIALMRGTIFLVTAQDCLRLRAVMHPAMVRAIAGTAGKRTAELDGTRLIETARVLLRERPRTFAELAEHLGPLFPGQDPADLSVRVRTELPLVQVPPRGLWGRTGASRHTTVDSWLGVPPADDPDPSEVIARYLTAFGPATVADIQAWSRLAGLRRHVEAMRPTLRTFSNEDGQELFDVPHGLLPPADTPVGVRILGDFDNVLLSHADRRRIFDDRHRSRFMTQNGLIRPTVLIDGFVAAVCRVDTAPGGLRLTVEPLEQIRVRDRPGIRAEGRRWLSFLDPQARTEVIIG